MNFSPATITGSIAPLRGASNVRKGTARMPAEGVGQSAETVERHPRAKSLFWTVTGRDFGRSIAWARRQPANVVTAAMRAAALKKF